jgi:LacI family transcriptional regulator
MAESYPMLTVALLLDVDFDISLQILQGVQHVARREPRWRLLPLRSTQEELLESLMRRHVLGGVIGAFLSDRWLQGLPGPSIPLVNIADHSDIRQVPSVINDNRQVGRLAACHLLQQGFRSFGVVHESASFAARERREAFIGLMEQEGHNVSEPPAVNSYAPDAGWPEWLKRLERPGGLFCTSDHLARRLLQHIEFCHADVPGDFGVVGVGNAPLDNLLARIPLSSIELDGFRIGEEAAGCLARLLDARDAPIARRQTVAPRQLVPRDSSVHLPGGDPLVDRALAHQDLAQPLTGAALSLACGASRRTLETRCRRLLGCGPATHLRRRRLAHADLLLRETRLTLAAIAEATGYASASAFSAAFRQAHGLAPGAWRRAHQTISMQSP